MKKILVNLFIVAFSFIVTNSLFASQTLKFGLFPYDSPSKLYKEFLPLANYLSKKIDREIEIVLAPNYTRQIKNIGNGFVDFALVGPAPYVKLNDNYQNITILAELKYKNNADEYVVIFTNKHSEIQSIQDLKGKTFVFGDYQSCGSHFYPRYILEKNGIGLNDLKLYNFISGHSKVILAVEHGDFDAGGVRKDIYERYKDRDIKTIAGPIKIAPHVIVARKDMPEKLKKAIKKALLELNDKKILQSFHPELEGFYASSDSKFNKIRSIINSIEGD